ncbi:MAG TPA: hypothetical protein VEQ10_05690 [Vicinamibacteria bacterium]|nr:hypothetical protein [Vicinamibacteria bacterium]
MKLFGKSLPEYVRFEQAILWLILAVGLARLVLSLAGLPNGTVKFFSITVVFLVGILYVGIRVPQAGFGGYRHLLPLLYLQAILANGIAILGIVLARFGLHNIYAANEYGGNTGARVHVLGHLGVALIGPLVTWLVAALVMWVTRRFVTPSAAKGATSTPAARGAN